MREILFRGKRIDNGEWIYGSFVSWFDGSASIDTGKYDDPMYAVAPSTVGQYTGLTDKNGVKIFEGDVIHEITQNSKGNFEVKYKYGQFCIGICVPIWHVSKLCEVIGNIYDNPELIDNPRS